MPAFASIEAAPAPLSRQATAVGVYRYRPGGSPRYEHLPNILVLSIQYREGADPGVARFRYIFDAAGPASDPTSFEQVLSVDSDLAGVVRNDDRLVVLGFTSDAGPFALFDGFAQVPELSLSPTAELVTFLAFGVAVREWDTPIGGALMRDADDPMVVSDVPTDLETHFNPGGNPNATPEGADATASDGNNYPTFLDHLAIRSPDLRRKWTLPMAVRYLCYGQNPDQAYVRNPDGAAIDALLDSRSPKSGGSFHPDDPATYTSDPIAVPDYPATGKVWPAAMEELLAPQGFAMAFRLETDLDGDPRTSLDIFRRDDGAPSTYKDLYLQARGSGLDPARTNLAEARLARDMTGVANAYQVESGLVRYEASFVLAPGFPVAATDAADATALRAFDKTDPSFSQANHDRYRLYILDETGEGHWDVTSTSMVNVAPSLKALLGGDYVKRRRVPLGELFTTDPNRKPLKARLSISTDYMGNGPGLWDGSGTWQPVAGGFELLKDRLGIWIDAPNPNGWIIGASHTAGTPYPAGIVKGVEDQVAGRGRGFILRLTCVIEGDRTVAAIADRRPSSPTAYTITRRVDARDRYVKHIKAAGGEFNPTGQVVVVRDDTSDAQADADARRLSGESGEIAGSVTIPRFTCAYAIGDRIRAIRGRDLWLRTNAGVPADETEVFPAVVGLTWDFDGKQQTILHLSDRRGDGR